jgi:DNA primase
MDAVEEVKSRLDIEQVVGPHVDLKRSGSGLKGLCPFHSEKTPSFYVFPARGTFHCFGCGQGGDILTFVQNYDRVDFREALHRLASRAGIELPDERVRQQRVEENARLYQANEAAAEFFREQLGSAAGKRAAAYLNSRKISARARHAFGIGYAADGRHVLSEALSTRGFTTQELLAAGLVFAPDDGSQPRDRFHGRLMFPIRDAKNRITGFGGRIMGDGEPKYLNSPQTELFDKSRSLFGIELAQEPIRQGKRAVVVEGYIDAIRAHEAGFKDVVASLGTAITTPQLQICSRLAPTVVLALDPDPAGQAAAARTALNALAALPRRQRQLPDSLGRRMVDVGLSVDLRIARIPEGAGDPDELIQRNPDEWVPILDRSVPAFEFYFDTVIASIDRSAEGWRQEIIDRVIPAIQEFPFAVGMQAAWVERLGEVTGVQARLLQNRLMAGTPTAGRRTAPRKPAQGQTLAASKAVKSVDPAREAENSLLQILLRKTCPVELVPALADIRSNRAEIAELLQRCVEHAGSGRRPTLVGLSAEATSLANELLAAESEDLSERRVVPAIRLHLAGMRLSSVRRRRTELQGLLPEIGKEDRETGRRSLAQLLDEQRDLEQQIDELQRNVIAGR